MKDSKTQQKLQDRIDKALHPPYIKVEVFVRSKEKPKYTAKNQDGEYIASGNTQTLFFWRFNCFFSIGSYLD
jgi:hypothetical protein